MSKLNEKSIIITIDDSNTEDTEKYMNALKKYVLDIKKSIQISGTFLNPVILGKHKKDDEEARANASQVDVLTYMLGLIENRKKISGQKLTTPKSIKCFLQGIRNEYVKNTKIGTYGEEQAFLMDLIDSELYNKTRLNLFPVPENITHDEQLLKLEIMKILKDTVLSKKKNFKKLTTNKIVEIVLNTNKDLAKKDDLINIANYILRTKK